ncbi:hypothetical protein SSBR45G_03740 [Bradyrhizobium sp. SSBR45G]|uniref:hypothetical protein n=1 Tax=unclassified Bradyrhizobium TaxID=2631580 RepID=UPI002342999D|nr:MULTISPECIES: hypothetical protein [unclassified Bradyrhizobium]GLH75466.1 hypothetical protein SSBR45G_03740 [Bradyrhizobium sp. SSBR45G]GLH82747.1 hypothetical protein SSBR45R_02070 [Bradyrhizobium sp. SSBR45R]
MRRIGPVLLAAAIITPAHAYDQGQRVTAAAAAVSCRSWQTLKTLGDLMGDTPRFAAFWRAKKASGECRTFPVGTVVAVEDDQRAGSKAIMRMRTAADGVYWTYPWYFR